jgi:hypothetical protein
MGREEDLVAGSAEIDPVGSEEVTGRVEGLAIVPPSAESAEAIVPAAPGAGHARPLRESAVIDRAVLRLPDNVLPLSGTVEIGRVADWSGIARPTIRRDPTWATTSAS